MKSSVRLSREISEFLEDWLDDFSPNFALTLPGARLFDALHAYAVGGFGIYAPLVK